MDEEQIKQEMIDLLMEKITGGLSEKVVDYGNNPRNYGTLAKPDGYAKIKGPCGDTMEMFLKVRNDKIVDITKYPLTISLFRAIGVVVISKDLANLIH